MHDVVVQANYGTGTVKSVMKPGKKNVATGKKNAARANVEFKDKQVGLKYVNINSLSCNGQRCQFAFVCNALDWQWMGMYQKLVAYKKQFRSTKVPYRYIEDPKLGYWVKKQRGLYKKNKLSDKRTDLLKRVL